MADHDTMDFIVASRDRAWRTPDERRRLLSAFRYADVSESLLSLRNRVEAAIEQAAKATTTRRRDAHLYLADVNALLRDELRHETAYALETERVKVRPDGFVRRVKIPIEAAVGPVSVTGAVALATIEFISGARSAGLCPYCGKWWTSDQRRSRAKRCERPECDAARVAEWHRKHRPRGDSTARTRKWRQDKPRKGVKK